MRSRIACLLALLVSASVAAENSTELNVLDFGAAGDGKTDNTKAFQTALDSAERTGAVVTVPHGRFRIDGHIVIPRGVALEGTWRGPHHPEIASGSALLAYAGRGREDGDPFIILTHNSTLKGVTIWYPEQKTSDIRPYPWTISVRGSRCNILDVTIANAYNGIDCGTRQNDSHLVRNVNMSALRRGVFIDRCYDIGRFENVHIVHMDWNSMGKEGGMEDINTYKKFILQNLEGFIIGKCDWDYMVNCFVIYAKVGFRFVEMKLEPGKSLGQAPAGNILITQSGSDLSPLAVQIEKIQDHSGIAFENCQFMNSIEIEETNTGPVKLTNCGFWGQCRTGSVILNRGKGEVFLTSCHFSAWEDQKNPYVWDPKIPFIRMEDGALLMTACVFKDYGHTPEDHIYLGENVRSAAIMGTSAQGGTLRIDNRSKGEVNVIGCGEWK